jgi:O-glycosyl hydrolase
MAGKYESALSFNGINNWVTVADANSLHLIAAMTLEAWVMPTAAIADWTTVLLKERPGGLAYALYAADGAGQPPAGYINRNGADVHATGNSVLPRNAWSHLAATYDGASVRLYVNGSLIGSRAQTGSINTSSGSLRIGGNLVWGEYFSGLIDEVRVYNNDLTADQIQTDMNSPIQGPADTVAPTVALTAPANGATVSGSATVAANASDNVAVAGVQFELDGANLGAEATTAPYSILWDTASASPGTHTLTAVARDTSNNLASSASFTVTVADSDTTPPSVFISSPDNNATVSGTITIAANAGDNVGVAGVQFLLDGNNLGAEDFTSPYTVSWDTSGATNGTHTLTAQSRDAAGNTTTSAQVTVVVSNASGVSLAIDGGQTFQKIAGFGVNVNAHSWNDGELRPALDMLNDQMGSTLYRVVYDMEDWESTNDNADPNTADWTYYNALYSNASFQELWGTLRYLNQKGVNSGITLSFMGRVPMWMGGNAINTSLEDEWVETITTLASYARNTEHVQFALLDPLNEPDWDGIEGPQVDEVQYTRLLNKLSAKLDALGLGDIRLLGPNTASIDTGVSNYMPAMMADPIVMAKLDHFAFHNYAGSTGGADAALHGSPYPTKDFWITEVTNPWDVMGHIGGNAAAVMVWDGYDSAYIHPTLHGASMDPPNDSGNGPAPLAYDPSTGVYAPRKSFYQLSQIFKFAPPGSLRVSVTQSGSELIAYAFYDQAGGRLTILGQNSGT